MLTEGHWVGVRDADPRALALARRHYSWHEYRDHRPRRKFIGPGEYMCLLTADCDALFVWRKFISMDHQAGVNCAIFRNESTVLSSELITEAMILAWQCWPGERLYTYVNPRKVRSTNPGYCFKVAGWTVCGWSKSGLVILEMVADT
jgi:hypothetical protein